VQNGSFEKFISNSVPSIPRIDSAKYWSTSHGCCIKVLSPKYQNPSLSTPNNSFGWQPPKTGTNYVVFHYITSVTSSNDLIIEKDEHFQNHLSNSLIQNQTYKVRAYISNASWPGGQHNYNALDSIGFILSDTSIYTGNQSIFPLNQNYDLVDTSGYYSDSVNWIEVGGTYTAQGGEEYLIIGFHMSTANLQNLPILHNYYFPLSAVSACYYIDDVAIWPADTIPPPADAGNDTTICRGGKAKLGTHNYSDYIYEWRPSITLSNDSGGLVWASPQTTTTYYLQATDDIYTKTMDSVTVFVNNCGQNDTVVCIEQQFTMGSTNNPNWHYQWSPSASLSSDTVGMPLCSPLSNQSYQLLITNSTGDTIALDSTTVLVGSCYYAEAGIDSLICKGDSLQIGTQNHSFIDYSWSPDYMISDTATGTPIVWPDTTIYYYLQLTDTMGNITMDSVKISVQTCIGIKEIYPFENGVRIYPNPASSQITIEFEQNPKKDFQVLLYDITGKLIINKSIWQKKEFTIDISNLKKGFYIVTIKEENKVLISKKIMKN